MIERGETVRLLDVISQMTDAEIAHNAKWIREIANSAHVHMKRLRADLHKYKMADKNDAINARRKASKEAPQS